MTVAEPVHCQSCGAPTKERDAHGRRRPVCTACGAVTFLDPKLAAAVLVERGGRVLLGRRGEGARAAGRWSFPAGFVERGEPVEAAAAREAREETGLAVAVGPLLGLYSAPGETVVLAVYLADAPEGEPEAGDDLDAVGWFAPNALPDLAFPHDGRILADWRERRDRRPEPPLDAAALGQPGT